MPSEHFFDIGANLGKLGHHVVERGDAVWSDEGVELGLALCLDF